MRIISKYVGSEAGEAAARVKHPGSQTAGESVEVRAVLKNKSGVGIMD